MESVFATFFFIPFSGNSELEISHWSYFHLQVTSKIRSAQCLFLMGDNNYETILAHLKMNVV